MRRPTTRPNILIFLTDQEQAAVTEPGHPCHTPNAARLAAEGLRFAHASCPAAHCCPSRATMMTGLAPSRHGIFNNVSNPAAIHTSLRPGVRTFAEQLAAVGYRLVFAGKWHVSGDEGPADRGWEERLVRAGPGVRPLREAARRPGPSTERRPGELRRPGWNPWHLYLTYDTDGPSGFEGTHDHHVVRAAVDALDELCRSPEPWVLYVGPTGPHDPYLVPRRFVDRYRLDEVALPASHRDELTDRPGVYRRLRQQLWSALDEDEVRDAVRHYWAYCTYEDALLGELLTALERSGQQERTVVVRTADHGDYVGAHGLFLKGIPAFREAYDIPLVIRWPDGIAAPGRRVDHLVTLADLTPTFLELGQADGGPELTGRSLVPFLADRPPADWPDAVHTQMNGVELAYTQRSVTTATHKYVYNGFDFDELYDLVADPHELVNLDGDPAHEDTKRDLVARMWRYADTEDDEIIFSQYPPVGLVPWGPATALGGRS